MNAKETINEILDMTINPNMRVAQWNESRWILLSSFFFTIPAIYGFYTELYNFSVVLLLTSLISANYWRDASYSYRRIIDKIFAKISFSIFFYNGLYYVRIFPYVIAGYSGLVVLLYCYYASNKYCGHNKIWVKYHMTFHFFIALNQLIILDSVLKYNEQTTDNKQMY